MSRSSLACWVRAFLIALCHFLLVETALAKVQLVGETFKINEKSEGELPEVLALPDGGFLVLWQDPAAAFDLRTRGRRFDSAARPLGVEFAVQSGGRPPAAVRGDSLVMVAEPVFGDERVALFNLQGVLQQELPVPAVDALTVTANGDVVVAWSNQEFVRGSLIHFDGEPIETRFVIDDHTTEYQVDVRAASASGGPFVVLWMADQTGIFWARSFDIDTTPRGDRLRVSDPQNPLLPDLCFDSDSENLVVAWHTEGEGKFRRLGADGSIASRIRCTGLDLPSLSCLSEDRFVAVGVASKVGSGRDSIGVRAFDAENRTIGTTTLFPPLVLDAHILPSSATTADGTVIVAWHHCNAISGGCDVFGQRLSVSSELDCSGDCNGDGRVSIDELVTAVDIVRIQRTDLVRCPTLESDVLEDRNQDCGVPLNALVTAVRHALTGCD